MSDAKHQAARYIPIGDVELPLPLIARALGIPAATLDKLASGELVAVPRARITNLASEMCEGWCTEGGIGKFHDCYGCKINSLLTAATEATSHDLG